MSDKEVKMSKSMNINVSADDLWQIVGPGFANVGNWSTAVDYSVGAGTGSFEGATCDSRTCDVSAKGFSKVQEQITEYDQTNRTLAFTVHGMPGFVTSADNRTVITDLGNGKSRVELAITMKMKPLMGTLLGGMFKKNLSNAIDSLLDDLKVFAETGKPSARKDARMAKISVKAA